MNIIIALLFIIITILSIIVFKVKGLFTLLISIPLVIMYYKASDIIKLLKKKEKYILTNDDKCLLICL